jgi:hypothetical protein
VRAIKLSLEGDVFEQNVQDVDALFELGDWAWGYAETFDDYTNLDGAPIFVYPNFDRGGRLVHNRLASAINSRGSLGRTVDLYGDVYLFNRDSTANGAEVVGLQDDITVAVVREALEEARRRAR